MRNDNYVELPAEMEQPGCCGRLHKALYGTREAARCWKQEYVRMLETIGFRRGSASPYAFWHKDVVHGDDFTSSGAENELRWLVQEFEKKYITKVRGIVGPDSHDLRSMTVPNRILLTSWAVMLSKASCARRMLSGSGHWRPGEIS